MANTVRIKRRAAGGAAGAPSSLANAELAYNEQDDILYYGFGTGGAGGTATTVKAIAGPGWAVQLGGSYADPSWITSLAWSKITGRPTTLSGYGITDAVNKGGDTMTGVLITAAGTASVAGGLQLTSGTLKSSPVVGDSGAIEYNGTAVSIINSAGSRQTFAYLASPAFTGTPTAPTAAANTNTTQIATTAFVLGQANSTAGTIAMNGTQAAGSSNLYARADHVHPTDTSRAPLASPTFTGTPAAPTAAVDTNTTQLATTAFVLAQAASATPAALGTAAVGTSTRFARGDHVHAMPTFSQIGTATADVSIGGFKLTNVADPVNAQDAATKAYVDSTAQGLDVKASVKVATTANITLSATQTIDGISVLAGDRVLVKNQTTASQNGIYVAAAGAWSRSSDLDLWAEFPGAFTFVEQGTTNGDTGWVCTVDAGGTLGTTSVTFAQFSGAGTYLAGNGLSLTGSTFAAVGTANRISVSAGGIDIASTYVGQTSITTLGTITTGTWNGTTIAVANGGTGATTLTGYVKGNGTSAFTASSTIPNTDITGLGTMSTQASSNVSITGGSITNLTTFDGITIDGGTF